MRKLYFYLTILLYFVLLIPSEAQITVTMPNFSGCPSLTPITLNKITIRETNPTNFINDGNGFAQTITLKLSGSATFVAGSPTVTIVNSPKDITFSAPSYTFTAPDEIRISILGAGVTNANIDIIEITGLQILVVGTYSGDIKVSARSGDTFPATLINNVVGTINITNAEIDITGVQLCTPITTCPQCSDNPGTCIPQQLLLAGATACGGVNQVPTCPNGCTNYPACNDCLDPCNPCTVDCPTYPNCGLDPCQVVCRSGCPDFPNCLSIQKNTTNNEPIIVEQTVGHTIEVCDAREPVCINISTPVSNYVVTSWKVFDNGTGNADITANFNVSVSNNTVTLQPISTSSWIHNQEFYIQASLPSGCDAESDDAIRIIYWGGSTDTKLELIDGDSQQPSTGVAINGNTALEYSVGNNSAPAEFRVVQPSTPDFETIPSGDLVYEIVGVGVSKSTVAGYLDASLPADQDNPQPFIFDPGASSIARRTGTYVVYLNWFLWDGTNKKLCKSVPITITVFDNTPRQLIGIKNASVCRDGTINQIPIGWIGQGQVGYLRCIRIKPNTSCISSSGNNFNCSTCSGTKTVNNSVAQTNITAQDTDIPNNTEIISGALNPTYENSRGILSGFVINRDRIPLGTTEFRVIIRYEIIIRDASNTLIQGIYREVEENIKVEDTPTPTITLVSGQSIQTDYCANSPSIELLGSLNGGIKTFRVKNLQNNFIFNLNTINPVNPIRKIAFDSLGAPRIASNSLILPPNNNAGYRVLYTYESDAGCQGIDSVEFKVRSLPDSLIASDFKFCVGNTQLPLLQISGANYAGKHIRWYTSSGILLFDDPINLGYNSGLPPNISGEYNFKVAEVNSFGCERDIKSDIKVIIGSPPTPNFTATEACVGGTVNFTDLSTPIPGSGIIARDSIIRYFWDFGDLASNTDTSSVRNATYTFTNAGIYNVTLTVSTNSNCVRSISKKVVVHKNTQLIGGIYSEDFENTDTTQITWTSSRWTEPNGASNKSTWKIIPITRADGTTGRAFVTSNINNTYNNSEYSWIESPCFDLSVLSAPLINIKMRYNTDFKADGSFIMYTTDNGTNWKVLGDLNQGAEWYNGGDILGLSVLPSINPNRKGWSGKSNDFVEAKLSLSSIKQEISANPTTPVRFRIVFASNADNPANNSFDGVAIDRVVILDKNHKVLLEHFTNTTSSSYQDPTWTTFVNNGIAKTDLVHVQYHTTFPTGDALGQDSRPESNARSLHYAVSQPPYTVVDGRMEAGKILYKDWNWNATGGSDAYNYYLQRSLVAAAFNIGTPTFSGGTGGTFLGISVNISRTNAPSDRTSAVVAHAMIVENDVNGNKNVVRRMLPSPAGTRLENIWALGSSHTLQGSWKPRSSAPSGTYSLVVFIADEQTKEVYQAEIFPINQNVDARTAEKLVTMNAEDINLYPNPTSSDVTVVLPETPSGKVTWRMFDALGREVEGGSGTTDNALFRVTTQHCNKGIYIIEITTSEWKVRKSISVIK